MTRLRFLVATLVTWYRPSKSYSLPSSFTNAGNAIEAKLHTATSSDEVYSMISVHRFEQWIVPKFCWLDLRFAWSLYSMYGVPVSIWDSKMRNHSCWAFTVFRPFFSDSKRVYRLSNSSPHTSISPLPVASSYASFGQNSVHSLSSFTRRMNRSGIHKA